MIRQSALRGKWLNGIMVFPEIPNRNDRMDKLSAIDAFIKVAQSGSFTAASAQLSISPSAVTKSVSQLENQLNVRLLNRTTHGVALTEEGAAYLARCVPILGELAEAERLLAVRRGESAGRLRVSMPHALARLFVTPELPAFYAAHPDIQLELALVDHAIDLVEYKLDLAVRIGAPRAGRAHARELARTQRATAAAPAYLRERGTPRTVDDLRAHNCLCLLFNGKRRLWRFSANPRVASFVPAGNLVVNSGDELREALLHGLGVAQINSILIERELRAGILRPVLPQHAVASDTLYAVYPQTRYLPPRARAFVDFLEEVFRPFRKPSALS
jgi:DNA-binding transcriptional LysR family regulator